MKARLVRMLMTIGCLVPLFSSAQAVTLEWDVPGLYTIYRGVKGPIGVRDYVWIAQVEHPTGTYTDNATPVCSASPCRKLPRYIYVVQASITASGALSGYSNSATAGDDLPGWMVAEAGLLQLGGPVKVRWSGLQGTATTDTITFHIAYDSPDTIVSSMAVTHTNCTGGGTGTGECTFTLPGTISGWGPWDFRYRQANGDILAASQAVYLQQ